MEMVTLHFYSVSRHATVQLPGIRGFISHSCELGLNLSVKCNIGEHFLRIVKLSHWAVVLLTKVLFFVEGRKDGGRRGGTVGGEEPIYQDGQTCGVFYFAPCPQ